MSEKILGFKQKDASEPVVSDGQGGIYFREKPTYEIKKSKLVPVVSKEGLLQEIKKVKYQGSWKAFLEFAKKYEPKAKKR